MRFGFTLLILMLLALPAVAGQTLKLSQVGNSASQQLGLKLLESAYAKLGIAVEAVKMPGKRALIESSEGRIDGEIFRIHDIANSYPTLLRIPTSIHTSKPSIFSKKVNFKLDGCASLKTQYVGRIRGIRHTEICARGIHKVAVFADSVNLLQSLHKDIIDFAITTHFNGMYHLNRLGFDSIHPLKPVLSEIPVYHYLHEKHSTLVKQINEVLLQMLQSGEMETLKSKYTKDILGTRNRHN